MKNCIKDKALTLKIIPSGTNIMIHGEAAWINHDIPEGRLLQYYPVSSAELLLKNIEHVIIEWSKVAGINVCTRENDK